MYHILLILLQAFTSALARRHYHSHLKARIWEAWFGVIRERWRQRVERACQVSKIPQLARISHLHMLKKMVSVTVPLLYPLDKGRGSVCQIDLRL